MFAATSDSTSAARCAALQIAECGMAACSSSRAIKNAVQFDAKKMQLSVNRKSKS